MELKSSSLKVQQYLRDHDCPGDVLQIPQSTRTAAEAASAIGCEVAQIAKSLVFRNAQTGEPVLVIASGANRVSVSKIEAATGMMLKKADADFVREQVGFAIGGVPPVGHEKAIATLLDQDLQSFSQLWAAAGTPNSLFSIDPDSLARLTHGRWLDLAE